MHFVAAFGIADVLPRFHFGNVAVGAIRQRGDFAHRPPHFAALVEFGHFVAGRGHGIPKFLVLNGCRQLAVEGLADEASAARGDVHHLADQVGINAQHEVVQVDVHIVDAVRNLGAEVVAQIFRIQMRQIGFGVDEGAAGFRHALAIDG